MALGEDWQDEELNVEGGNIQEQQGELEIKLQDIDIYADLESFGKAVDDLEEIFQGKSERTREEVSRTVESLKLYQFMSKNSFFGDHEDEKMKEMMSSFSQRWNDITFFILEQQNQVKALENSRKRVFEIIRNSMNEGKFEGLTQDQVFEGMKNPTVREIRDFSFKAWCLLEVIQEVALYLQQQKENLIS